MKTKHYTYPAVHNIAYRIRCVHDNQPTDITKIAVDHVDNIMKFAEMLRATDTKIDEMDELIESARSFRREYAHAKQLSHAVVCLGRAIQSFLMANSGSSISSYYDEHAMYAVKWMNKADQAIADYCGQMHVRDSFVTKRQN